MQLYRNVLVGLGTSLSSNGISLTKQFSCMTPEEIDFMAVDTVGEDMEVTGFKSEDALNKNK